MDDGWKPKAGNCYEDCLLILVEGRYNRKGSTCYLVHGYPCLSSDASGHKEGTKYGHAWIERETEFSGHTHVECISVLEDSVVPKDLYYHGGKINPDEVSRFTKAAAVSIALITGVNGPWDNIPTDAVFRN